MKKRGAWACERGGTAVKLFQKVGAMFRLKEKVHGKIKNWLPAMVISQSQQVRVVWGLVAGRLKATSGIGFQTSEKMESFDGSAMLASLWKSFEPEAGDWQEVAISCSNVIFYRVWFISYFVYMLFIQNLKKGFHKRLSLKVVRTMSMCEPSSRLYRFNLHAL